MEFQRGGLKFMDLLNIKICHQGNLKTDKMMKNLDETAKTATMNQKFPEKM